MTALSLQNVYYTYNPGTPFTTEALQNVSISFEKGKITGIIGHTGSGKSTLLEMMAGLLAPTQGRVLLDGQDLYLTPKEATHQKMTELGCAQMGTFLRSVFFHRQWKKILKEQTAQIRANKLRIGLVMQYPEYQLFDDTVLSDMCYGPKNQGKSQAEAEECAREAADIVGLSHELFTKSPFDLSGGEKRRVAIAGVLAMKPEILLLDEPAAGLDPIGRQKLFEGISNYNKQTGATVILISHSMEDLAMYCDAVVVMHEGKLNRTGTVAEVFKNPQELTDLGLDVPQITYIAAELIKNGIALEGDLWTVDGVERAILAYLEKGKDDHV